MAGMTARTVGILAALGVACVAFGFQQTAVIPAIPTIQHDLHASREWSAWLLSGYLVASSISTPLLGKLGDRVGKRRMLLLALGLFLVGSIGAALAPSLGVLIAFRAVQGVGGAVFPLTLAIVRDELPAERVGMGIGLLTGGFGLGTALGFGLSGLLVQELSWRWVFAVGAVAIAAATALVPVVVPRSGGQGEGGLGLVGGVLLTGGLAVGLTALTEGVQLGWGSPWVVGGFVLAVVLLGGWIAHDLRVDEPLLDLHVLAGRTVLLTNLASLGLGFALFGVYFLVPYLVQGSGRAGYGFDADPLATGLYLLPAAIGQLVTGPLTGPLEGRAGPKWTFAAGLALSAVGAAGLAVAHGAGWLVALWALFFGAGAGLAIGVASTLSAEAVAASETGIATALNSVLRRVGGGIGGQIAAALLAGLTLAGTTTPSNGAFVVAFAACAAVALVAAGLAVAIRPEPA